MGKKGDLSDFERGMVVGFRRAGQSISKTADLLGFSLTTISRVYREWSEKEKISSEWELWGRKCLVDVRGQRRMGRLVRDDRKATVTQITTRYNQGMQNTISERTSHRTLKQMCYSSRRPHRVRSYKLRTGNGGYNSHRLTKIGHYNIGNMLPGLMSLDFCCDIQMVGSEFGIKNIKALIHPALSQWFRLVVVWEIFSWCTLGPSVPIEHCLNATAYLSIVAEHVHPFMNTVYPSSDGYLQQDNVTKLKSSQTGFLNMTMSSLYSIGLHSHQISIQ